MADAVVDELDAELSMVPELLLRAGPLLPKAPPVDGIVRCRRTGVVGEEQIIGDLVPLPGLIPEPVYVLNEIALMVY